MSAADGHSELVRLANRYCDDALEPMELEQLQALLKQDAASRELFRRLTALHADLVWNESACRELVIPSPVPAPAPQVIQRALGLPGKPIHWSILAVGVLFAGYVVLISWNMLGRGRSDRLTASSRNGHQDNAAVATVTASEATKWQGASATRLTAASTRGLPEPITPGEPLQLASGLVELQLKQGATLLIEGPADWKINGDNSATLNRGKLVAEVPTQAVGFTLETPTAKIVDLGTEFGVDVEPDGSSTVTVLNGKVETHSNAAGGKSVQLSAGQAVRLVRNSPNPETIPFDTQAFANVSRRLTKDARHNKPVLLFSDNFDVVGPSNDINPGPNDKPGRQSGVLAPRDFLELDGKTAASTQLGSPFARHGLLLAGDAVVRTSVSPAIDFVQQKTRPARYRVEFLLNPGRRFDGAADTQFNWGGVHVGASERSALVPGPGCGVTFLVRGNGGYQFFDREKLVREGTLRETVGAADLSGWCKVRVDFAVPAFDGVSPGSVKVFVNDRTLVEYQTQSGFTNNFVGLDGMSSPDIYHTFDDFKVLYEELPFSEGRSP